MPSFDIVCKVDAQVVDNVVNVAKREILNRFDFRDSKSQIDFDKKSNQINITTENDMRIKAIEDELVKRAIKQNLDIHAFDFSAKEYASGTMMKKEIKLKQGIDKEGQKKIMKVIKDSNLKVQASVMDEQVRVTAKKIDDLQALIAQLRAGNLEMPLQFTNMK
ncbi:MAG: YajQ family cyclic di-GMP-binding protein [Cytophagales bacterium]